MKHDAKNWTSQPGGYDVLHTRLWSPEQLTNQGYPVMGADPTIPIPSALVQFRYQIQQPYDAIHFFIDDYRFECVWNHPKIYTQRFKGKIILSPDFSIYSDWPLMTQKWNHYRKMWLSAYLQTHGVKVIPSISWGSPISFGWCFEGLPEGGMVAISAVGAKEYPYDFSKGFDAMIQALQPKCVLCLGNFYDVYKGQTEVKIIQYPHLFGKRRHQRGDLDGR